MTLRERIADWISGGALTRAKMEIRAIRVAWRQSGFELRDRLNRIAALETPSANATVRKMARIARGEG